jgi:hypothetical protein
VTTLRYIVDTSAPNARATFDGITSRLIKLDESLKRTREIGIGDKQAAANLIRTQLRVDKLRESLNMDMSIRGAASAEAKLLTLEHTADRLDHKMTSTTAAVEGLGEDAVGLGANLGALSNFAMPALIGSLVALSPVIATVGVGLGGFGLAALGVAKDSREMGQVVRPLKPNSRRSLSRCNPRSWTSSPPGCG